MLLRRGIYSQRNYQLVYASDFSVDEDFFVPQNSGVSGNEDNIGGENDCLHLHQGTGSYSIISASRGVFVPGFPEAPNYYRLVADVYILDNGSNTNGIAIGLNGFDVSNYTEERGKWITLDVEGTTSFTGFIYFQALTNGVAGGVRGAEEAGMDAYFKNVRLYAELNPILPIPPP